MTQRIVLPDAGVELELPETEDGYIVAVNRSTVALDDDVLTTFSVLDQARDAATGGRGDGRVRWGVRQRRWSRQNYAEICVEGQGHQPHGEKRRKSWLDAWLGEARVREA